MLLKKILQKKKITLKFFHGLKSIFLKSFILTIIHTQQIKLCYIKNVFMLFDIQLLQKRVFIYLHLF